MQSFTRHMSLPNSQHLAVLGFIAISFSFCHCDAADEGTKTVSADGRYEVRITTSEKREIVSTAALHESKGGKMLIDLAAEHDLKGKAGDTDTQWQANSKAFAFYFLIKQTGATVIYRKEGDEFKAVPLPKLPPIKKEDGKETPDADAIITGGALAPVRWEDGHTLILEEYSIYNKGDVSVTYRKITVTVPETGAPVLKSVELVDGPLREEK